MARGVLLLQNVLAEHRQPLSAAGFLDLWATAVQAGDLGDAERAFLIGLRCAPKAAALRETLLAAAPQLGAAPNPEIARARREDPHFAQRVAALTNNVQPGDLIFWGSDERRFPWGVMQGSYGPWMHVSIVLGDGKLLDPYWPEGLTIATIEAALAKSARRIRARTLLVARPATPLTAAQLARLTNRAYAQVGRPYGLMFDPNGPSERASCSRAAWELFREEGVDLQQAGGRLAHYTITPRDLMQQPVALIRADGSVATDSFPSPEPTTRRFLWAGQAIDRAAQLLPGGGGALIASGGPVSAFFMRAMFPPALTEADAQAGLAATPAVGCFQATSQG